MAVPILKTAGLSKTYETKSNKVRALSNVSLVIERGELVAVMGPSGSGKTTLLTLLGCLDRPTSGKILLGPKALNITDIAESELYKIRRKLVGFIFQSFNLMPNLTAIENVELPMQGLIPSAARRRKRARLLLRVTEIPHREKHKPAQLSGGELQRVAIARALANGPNLILADEPTGNLDSETGSSIISLLRRLADEQKRTIIMVTHDPHMATYATRTLYLRDGKLQADESFKTSSAES
ncbi:MAG: ABC transporter ATP-binding protein [Chloroflexota bacterium]|nr:ABC transporter ATP-binding protein [Chloroflexota bacterium]